ncbi:hypothetical protein [Pseudoxanthomonas sp.]|uniref:hypothetical protein n=1 Tax=Pseudoxanthomonas sp. TaxID=1871049 RepID=UPI0026328BCC|nr:hypothetical protein [Pseudoxanthomonas sp.]WDS36398.1 MAG: hypothetical protein O8I58_00180 [Pseudoxanthomonas sp.]
MSMVRIGLKMLCGLLVLSAGGCASSAGLDGSNVSLACQQQARDAAEQPPFPKQLRDGKHGAELEQGIRDTRMSRACQQEVDQHAEVTFRTGSGT